MSLITLATGFGAVWAQGTPGVSAYLDPASGYTETQPIRLVIRVTGLANPRVNPPRLPNLTNLSVIAGPNTKKSFSWINPFHVFSFLGSPGLPCACPGPAQGSQRGSQKFPNQQKT